MRTVRRWSMFLFCVFSLFLMRTTVWAQSSDFSPSSPSSGDGFAQILSNITSFLGTSASALLIFCYFVSFIMFIVTGFMLYSQKNRQSTGKGPWIAAGTGIFFAGIAFIMQSLGVSMFGSSSTSTLFDKGQGTSDLNLWFSVLLLNPHFLMECVMNLVPGVSEGGS